MDRVEMTAALAQFHSFSLRVCVRSLFSGAVGVAHMFWLPFLLDRCCPQSPALGECLICIQHALCKPAPLWVYRLEHVRDLGNN